MDDIERQFAAIRAAEARAALVELRHRERVLEEAVRLAEAAARSADRQEETLGGRRP